MDKIRARSGTADSVDIAVLAALNLANVLTAERASSGTGAGMGDRVLELIRLVESAVGDAKPAAPERRGREAPNPLGDGGAAARRRSGNRASRRQGGAGPPRRRRRVPGLPAPGVLRRAPGRAADGGRARCCARGRTATAVAAHRSRRLARVRGVCAHRGPRQRPLRCSGAPPRRACRGARPRCSPARPRPGLRPTRRQARKGTRDVGSGPRARDAEPLRSAWATSSRSWTPSRTSHTIDRWTRC